MNSNELFKEFLKHCTKYESDLWGIVITREATSLRIIKPQNPDESNYLIYEIIEGSRISGTVSDLDELLELCIDTVGEDSIINNLEQDSEFKNYGYK